MSIGSFLQRFDEDAIASIRPASYIYAPLIRFCREEVEANITKEVLDRLENWTRKFPMSEPIKRPFADRGVSELLRNKIFFTQKFMDSQQNRVEGIALAFFEYVERSSGKPDWKICELGFAKHKCVGFYRVTVSTADPLDPSDQAVSMTSIDAHTQGWTEASPQKLIDEKIPYLLAKAQAALPAPIEPEAPLFNGAGQANQDERDEAMVAPILPHPAARAWYQVIGDALSGCIASVVDCFKRFFGLTN